MSQPWEGTVDQGLTRNQLLLGGAGLLAAGVVAGSARQLAPEVLGVVGEAAPLSGELFRQATFLPLVGTTFRLERPGQESVDLRLLELRDLRSPRHPDAPVIAESFSLRFVGPRRAALAQDTYIVRHRRLGRFALFIVPMGVSANQREYEAIVNRLAA